MHRILWLCLAACGASSVQERPGPRGLRADQHLAIASRADDRASELTHWPDIRPGGESGSPAEQSAARVWVGTWDTGAEHRRLAAIHRSAAAQIEAEYEEACGDTPAMVAARSPLRRYGLGTSPVTGGVLVLLSPEAGSPDALLSAMRCHRAWMMLGRSDMEACPLDLPGIQISARGDAHGIELTITVEDPAMVDELRRRAARDIEAAQRPPS